MKNKVLYVLTSGILWYIHAPTLIWIFLLVVAIIDSIDEFIKHNKY